jgi:hypothetical protein
MLNEMLMSPELDYASFDELQEAFHARGWTGGLPIVAPTVERVRRMIAASGRGARDVLGIVPPLFAEATVENVAVNAVMAGCKPEYMPVLIAGVEAACAADFGLFGVQATTHPCAVAMVVSGPVIERIGMNCGAGVMGPGNRANATLGRALRLILVNVGGAIPGNGDQSTQGNPGKYSYVVAENEAATPWAPYRVQLGFGETDSTVTVVSGEAPHNINDHFCRSGIDILTTAADTMATVGNNNGGTIGLGDVMVVLGPEHAVGISRDGLTVDDVRRFLFENARNRLGDIRNRGLWEMFAWPRWIDQSDDEARVPIVERPEDIHVIVSGGAGKHSAFIPTVGIQKSVTRKIADATY